MPEKVTLYVVSYDISGDRDRRQIAKVLEDYGRRVQYSVFECRLTQARYKKLYAKLLELCTEPGDSIRFYTICENCAAKVRMIGKQDEKPPEEEPVIII